ncbi:MAG: ABC transporter ATP-binding protein [Synechococcales bacterium]|nr:ABC transporter ATP-binding protein [Synechococcales bacterium]
MAQVVLENVYKSFPSRSARDSQPLETRSPLAVDATAPTVAAPHPTSLPTGTVLRNINLTVRDGEFMVLVGPSGCGKSTLLRLIAGLEPLTGGNIWVGDRRVNDLPPKQRDIAMVFQNYALYPHLSVYDNLAFGLRRMVRRPDMALDSESEVGPAAAANRGGNDWFKHWQDATLVQLTRPLPRSRRYQSQREQAIDKRVLTVAQMLQIEGLLDRLPRQLSGGQKQRVALGRAMARNPQVFLMDEPLSNLDAKLRIETRAQIVNLQRKLGTTTLYVTHDQTEAMTMGDRIAVMNGGVLQQVATPLDLYHSPANRFVAEFIGTMPMNFLSVTVTAPLLITHPAFRLTLPEKWDDQLRRYDGRSLLLGIRPEHLNLAVPAPKNLPIRVDRVETLGSDTHLIGTLLTPAGWSPDRIFLQARVSPDDRVVRYEELWLAIDPSKIHLFDPDTEEALIPSP